MIDPRTVAAAAPLAPDPDQARDWLRQELADPAYATAEPTLLDRAARAVGEFLARLLSPELPASWGPAAALIAGIVVAVVLVAALLVWGRPRRRARSRAVPAGLFGDDDARSADELRRDARAAAASSLWDAAIALRFRALARGLVERVVVDPVPGATAQSFARQAGRILPDHASGLASAASAFDDVRYLRRPGTAALYTELAELDAAVAAARPAFSEASA